MDLIEFEHRLERLIGRPTELRPFVCEGSPLACRIFLVGLNPATSMSGDFWECWTPGYGFDKKAWFDKYRAERAAKPLRPGRTRRQAVSATRRTIEAFLEGVGEVPVLETNINPNPSVDRQSLPEFYDRDLVFRFLLDAIDPQVIVVHGKEAVATLRAINPSAIVIEADHHFSRQTSFDTAREYGRKATDALLRPA